MSTKIVRTKTPGEAWGTSIEPDEGGGSQPVTDPTQIANCALWLDASQLVLADDAPVATWPDLSGNGYDAAQATGDNQPVCKTAIQNGLRVVRFDQSAHIQFLALSGAGLGLLQAVEGLTIAAALFNIDTTDPGIGFNCAYLLCASDGDGNGYTRAELSIVDVALGVIATNRDSVDAESDSPDATQLQTINGGFTASVPTFVNNATVHAVDFARGAVISDGGMRSVETFEEAPGPTENTPSDVIYVGSNVPGTAGLTGDVGEIVVYDRALTASERRQLVEYLSTKWATL